MFLFATQGLLPTDPRLPSIDSRAGSFWPGPVAPARNWASTVTPNPIPALPFPWIPGHGKRRPPRSELPQNRVEDVTRSSDLRQLRTICPVSTSARFSEKVPLSPWDFASKPRLATLEPRVFYSFQNRLTPTWIARLGPPDHPWPASRTQP